MQPEQFIATTAADAVQQIRAKLGPDAVVVNVRQVPGHWFRKAHIEVLAHAAEPTQPVTGQLLDTTDQDAPITVPPPVTSEIIPPISREEKTSTPQRQG